MYISRHQALTIWLNNDEKRMLLHLECHCFNLKSQSIIEFSRSLLPRSVEKRPMRLRSNNDEMRMLLHLECPFFILNDYTALENIDTTFTPPNALGFTGIHVRLYMNLCTAAALSGESAAPFVCIHARTYNCVTGCMRGWIMMHSGWIMRHSGIQVG